MIARILILPILASRQLSGPADWRMNEAGDIKSIKATRTVIDESTRLIPCLALGNRMDATKVVPEAIEANVGIYGFTK